MKFLTTTDGTRYVCDYAPAEQGKSTDLLLHGFPLTRNEWHYQVDKLLAEGYGVITPDLLGLKTVVGVAHD
ncbi:hypothetical protein S7711_07287 [Stachybotrys chartarum IBT 7711]|uniref:AB hydrolase-1 domain-containing protein n=1 Tax=Stachybotrys chartarum (strain CBS 109288 / IBT 7711) TaxID=1280523 RepID=A0A084BA01_STACB|nr:hypothetical protein S7711_07287 [Stachybotrys chartarum IBT 7711]